MKTIEDIKVEGLKVNEVYCCDSFELMKLMPDNFIDVIITDPPYGILDHKLDRKIDWKVISDEWNRILKKDAMIVMFGRGTQLYRWASYLDDLGFDFKEEIVWNKGQGSSALNPVMRIHELIVIYSRGKKKVKRVRVPYEEFEDGNKTEDDLKRLVIELKNKGKEDIIKYIENDFVKEFNKVRPVKHSITMAEDIKNCSRAVSLFEKIYFGVVEKSIIKIPREHYTMEHPTQKPVRLMERLINLTSDVGDLIYDPFAGSGSTLVAAKNLSRKFIGSEILEEYCKIADKRINLAVERLF
ncbi:MAG: DNA-methyltransferase [Minisyncoccia bacterium]